MLFGQGIQRQNGLRLLRHAFRLRSYGDSGGFADAISPYGDGWSCRVCDGGGVWRDVHVNLSIVAGTLVPVFSGVFLPLLPIPKRK